MMTTTPILRLITTAAGTFRVLVDGNVNPMLVGFHDENSAVTKARAMFPDAIISREVSEEEIQAAAEKEGFGTKSFSLKMWLPLNKEQPVASPFDLPRIILEPVSLEMVVGELAKTFCVGYMPSSNGRRSHNSKPQYDRSGAIRSLAYGSDCYVLTDEYWTEPNTKADDFPPIEEKSIYVGIILAGPRVDLLINLSKPLEQAYIRMELGDDKRSEWFHWTNQMIHINFQNLQTTLEEMF